MPQITVSSIYINNNGNEFLYLFPGISPSDITVEQINEKTTADGLTIETNDWDALYKNGETEDGEASLTFFGPTLIELEAVPTPGLQGIALQPIFDRLVEAPESFKQFIQS